MKSTVSLPSSVEERISGWVRIQEKFRHGFQAKGGLRPTVTLSRQYGCEGFPLALRLKELLDAASTQPWTIFDKALIDRVAQDEQISLQLLSHLEEPVRYLESFGFHPRGKVTTDEAFLKMAQYLVQFARAGNAIIVGRGGAILCGQLENCFHFRLEADLAWRLDSLVRRSGITPKEAGDQERAQSKLREHFYREHLGRDASDPALYDAMFNNARHSVAEMAAAIFGYVRHGWKGEGWSAPRIGS